MSEENRTDVAPAVPCIRLSRIPHLWNTQRSQKRSHTVRGWSIVRDRETKEMVYEIKFKRLVTEPPMDTVMRRPYSDEVEDYKEYKRVRQIMRDRQELAQAVVKKQALTPIVTVSVDGAGDGDEEVLGGSSRRHAVDESKDLAYADADRKDSLA